MKRETRKTLVQVERMNSATLRADQARDLLNSDAAQKRTIRELRKALMLSREQHEVCGHDDKCDYCREAREVADAALKPRAKR